MKNLFNDLAYAEIIDRINKLEPTTLPQWGKMNAGQMLHHCQKPLEIALEKKVFKLKSNLLAKWLFKKSMYNDKKWTKNLPTPRSFQVTDQRDFEKEKVDLAVLIKEFYDKGASHIWPIHPFFGKFTPEQWAKMQYKHLDHHLTQFGV